jgi:meso-butanediol dehydrogenase/(S,S)-butanediol dehydrogenase/diacetyl reductase
MSMEFTDKVALVTGGGQGIGADIARQFAELGARVFITHLPSAAETEAAAQTVEAIRATGGEILAGLLELPDERSAAACTADVQQQFGRLDILVNNAGVMQRASGLATSVDDFNRCFAVNHLGIWTMTQACLPLLKSSGEARIVNISSGAGRWGSANLPAYSASKAAAISLTQSLAEGLAPFNITVNAVCPGVVLTPMSRSFADITPFPDRTTRDNTSAMIEWSEKLIPLGRMQNAEDIAHAVAFFASSGARNITGQSLNVDGGIMMN